MIYDRPASRIKLMSWHKNIREMEGNKNSNSEWEGELDWLEWFDCGRLMWLVTISNDDVFSWQNIFFCGRWRHIAEGKLIMKMGFFHFDSPLKKFSYIASRRFFGWNMSKNCQISSSFVVVVEQPQKWNITQFFPFSTHL